MSDVDYDILTDTRLLCRLEYIGKAQSVEVTELPAAMQAALRRGVLDAEDEFEPFSMVTLHAGVLSSGIRLRIGSFAIIRGGLMGCVQAILQVSEEASGCFVIIQLYSRRDIVPRLPHISVVAPSNGVNIMSVQVQSVSALCEVMITGAESWLVNEFL